MTFPGSPKRTPTNSSQEAANGRGCVKTHLDPYNWLSGLEALI